MDKSFQREKIIRCGKQFIFPEIYRYTENQRKAAKAKRRGKTKVTCPKQKDLNDRRSRRYFLQIANGNFGVGDVVVHLTFSALYLPDTPEEALKIVTQLYLRRVAYERKRLNLPPLKYLLVMQIGRKIDGTHRIHFHILMNGGIDRDTLENLWWVYKGTKQAKYQDRILFGWANADRIRPNEKGISQLAGYMVQATVGKKHWTQSQNLETPWHKQPSDSKYSPRQIERICRLPEDSEDYRKFWEKKYPGYEFVSGDRYWSDESGWSVYLMMRRRPEGGNRENYRK